jgi:hypothetical protein
LAVAYAGIVSVAVRRAPSTSLITIERGPLVTLVGIIGLVAGALITLARPPLPNRQ